MGRSTGIILVVFVIGYPAHHPLVRLKNPVPWFVYTYVKCMGRSTGIILVVFVIGWYPAHQPLLSPTSKESCSLVRLYVLCQMYEYRYRSTVTCDYTCGVCHRA
uniref:Uncharacterized protein n=1 Tax=Cacopsylla melanoneura TaxID=428564 RepID=A0A8D8ZDZ6_9HEMI